MAITTKNALIEYIYRRLGAPSVSVEVDEDQITDIIESTIQEFTRFALEGQLTKYLKIDVVAPCTITLAPEARYVLKVAKGGGITFAGYGGAGYVLDYYSMITGGINLNDAISSTIILSNQRALLDKYFGNKLSYTYNENKKKLEIQETFSGPLIIEMSTDYIPDTVDYIYDHEWIKKMCVAQTRLLQSDVTGKFDSPLLGGARINYDRMQQRAESEIEVLREELIVKYGGPAPILIG